MIPKKIHFCWLSGDEYPPLIKHCIETWKKVLPDYEIVLWDTNRFDINSVAWVKEAYESKKYAFAADYIRLYAVYTEGGIYLDSDVEVLKPFDDLLRYDSFIGFEASTEKIEAAVFGAISGCEWIREAMRYYHDKHFSMNKNGSVELNTIAPVVFQNALNDAFSDFPSELPLNPLLLSNVKENIYLCPPIYFSPLKYDLEKSNGINIYNANKYKVNPNTYSIHRFTASWCLDVPLYLRIWDYFKRRYLRRHK